MSSVINRRKFIIGSTAGIGGFLLGQYSNKILPTSKQQKPNFVVIIADDMRWDALGVAGNRIIRTPALDQLANNNFYFQNNFVTSSMCPTSRASILTGQYARKHGIWSFAKPVDSELFKQTYPGIMRNHGYTTAYAGKWGLQKPLPITEFDIWEGFHGQGRYFNPKRKDNLHLTKLLQGQSENLITKLSSKKQPFCLTIGTKAPHVQDADPIPFQPDRQYQTYYANTKIPIPITATAEDFNALPDFLKKSEGRIRWQQRFSTDSDYQHSVKEYYRLVSGVDKLVAGVINSLKKAGTYNNTCIIFTSDNGFFLGEHGLAGKWIGLEESIRVPLIIKLPQGEKAGQIDKMSLNIDLNPTILDLANIPIPDSVQGKSLLSIMQKNETQNWRDHWLYEHHSNHPTIPQTDGIRSEQFKYLAYPEHEYEEFYDLINDPFEQHNLIKQEKYQTLIQQHQQQLKSMIAAYNK